jgi:hypothetical protein
VSQCPPVIRRKAGLHHRNKNIDNSLRRVTIPSNMNMATTTRNPRSLNTLLGVLHE